MRLLVSSGLNENCLHYQRVAGKEALMYGTKERERKSYWRKERFPIAGIFTRH